LPTVEKVQRWAGELTSVGERVGRHFPRAEPRRRAVEYIHGLLLDVGRKNSWQLAERLGDPSPYGVQHLLGRADWDADLVRDDLRAYALEHLADPLGVLVVDETGFLKKGAKSAGVQRQYSGTAGRVENCQVGVFLAYAGPNGRALIDRELYLPKEWAEDAARRREARVPGRVGFATKPQLALRMLQRAFGAGATAGWVAADEVYGSDGRLRRWLEERRQPYVVAVRSDQCVCVGLRQVRARALLAEAPAGAWQRLSAGAGAKGPRLYEWAAARINCPEPEAFQRWLLARRSISDSTDLAYYLCGGPPQTALQELVRVAGSRWAVEECFEIGKGECGLDQYEVRSWVGWHRHVTLAMFAQALLAVIRMRAAAEAGPKKGGGGRRRR
jgi:SRSO17 transposase